MKKLALLCFVVAFCMACSNETPENSEFKYGTDFAFVNSGNESNVGNRLVLPFIEIILEIGRKSRNCLGIGICDGNVCVPSCGNITSGVVSAVYSDNFSDEQTINMGYVILSLENAPPTPGSLTFYVDEDILVGSDANHSYTFLQGSYSFDSSVGSYGGYIIPLKIQNI